MLSEEKTYRTRDGSRTGIRVVPERKFSGTVYVWDELGTDNSYTNEGYYWADRRGDFDLIEEQPADRPFSYDACPMHADGRRRAVTRTGLEVVLFAGDLPGDHPVGGWLASDAQAFLRRWDADGYCARLSKMDMDLLVPPPPKRVVWVNLYDQGKGYGAGCEWYESQVTADGAFNRQSWKRLGNRAYQIEID